MDLFSRDRDSLQVGDEIAALRKEIAALARSMARGGGAAYRGARSESADFYADIVERVARALPLMRTGARGVEATIRDNPGRAVALVGLAGLGIAAAVLLSGRRR